MYTPPRLSHSVAVLAFVVLSIAPVHTGGQTPPGSSPERFQEQQAAPSPRVGSVLDFGGSVQHRKHGQQWQPVQVEQLVLDQDRLRTREQSKVSVQRLRLRDVYTLKHPSEVEFTTRKDQKCVSKEPSPQIMELATGLLHIIGKVVEVRTQNAVTCVEGTTVLIYFTTPPDTTEVINLVGSVTVWNQKADPVDPQNVILDKGVSLQANSRVLVVGPRHDSHFALVEEPRREGPSLYRDSHVVLLDRRRNADLQPQVGSNPQTDSLTPDTSPAGIKFIQNQNALLGINVLLPR